MIFPEKIRIPKRLAALSLAAMMAIPMFTTGASALEYSY